MIETLELRGFRGFESYRVTDLTTVNLIVGKNNCGKSSVLEAVELIVSSGHPSIFAELARRRGELITSRPRYAVDISHLFFGHVCEPGSRFVLWADEDHKLTARILSLEEVGEAAETWDSRRKTSRRDMDVEEEYSPAFGLSIESDSEGRSAVFPVAKDGTILSGYWPSSMRRVPSELPVRSLGLESFAPARMRDAWDEVLAAGREEEIARDMQLLVPEIDSIHFLTVGATTGGGILVGHRGGGRRTPIGSYGDGLRRLLALRLALVGANHGFLLIDEIDAGLHWTVMEDLWRLIVEVARNSNVQIFATTHSYDCISGLGSLVKSRPELAEEVAMHKVHPSLEQAMCFPGEQIPIAVEQGIELR